LQNVADEVFLIVRLELDKLGGYRKSLPIG
jgi:hypothetical protein